MRLASYNVENLFDRAKALNQETWADGKPVLDKFAELNALLGEITYTAARKKKMAKLLTELGLAKSDAGEFVILRRNRGKLLKRPKAGGIEIVAAGRADWTGSLELIDEPVNEDSMRNTARVMIDLKADVLGVVEAESRPVLSAFNTEILPALGGAYFRHVMLIDGNDARGIDVGLMTGIDFPIGRMRSHVDDCDAEGQTIFSRDCPEFEITTALGNSLVVLVNHFKSKGYGGKTDSDARRKRQAARVAEIYKGLIAEGAQYIAVIGDLNDTPDSAPLKPLIEGTDLKDIFTHENFEDGGYPGTYGLCNAGNKIDFIFLSPALYGKVQKAGIFRTGMWPGSKPKRWDCYESVTRPEEAASDHAAIWVDLDL